MKTLSQFSMMLILMIIIDDEFNINDSITIILEDGQTNIYVGGELSDQCNNNRFLICKKK
ncbi:MAG: hypothetical protein ACFFAS_14580 [Promethearchaeota archaeon]